MGRAHYSKTTLIMAGVSGLVTTILGSRWVFFPAQQSPLYVLRNLDVRRLYFSSAWRPSSFRYGRNKRAGQ